MKIEVVNIGGKMMSVSDSGQIVDEEMRTVTAHQMFRATVCGELSRDVAVIKSVQANEEHILEVAEQIMKLRAEQGESRYTKLEGRG